MDGAGDCDLLPVLGDALEEAGCADPGILGHCRSGGPYPHWSWLVEQTVEGTRPVRAASRRKPKDRREAGCRGLSLSPQFGAAFVLAGEVFVQARPDPPGRFGTAEEAAGQLLLGWTRSHRLP